MALPPIRPSVTPQTSAPRPTDPARSAAQRAFFQAAMGLEAPTTPAARPVEAVQPTSRFTPQASQRASIPEAAPARILRPGSFLDIKV